MSSLTAQSLRSRGGRQSLWYARQMSSWCGELLPLNPDMLTLRRRESSPFNMSLHRHSPCAS